MNEDFPAAHSMDTAWFAIDADGYLGVFETGEPGAVPEGAPIVYEEIGDVVAGALADRPPAPQLWDQAALTARARGELHRAHTCDPPRGAVVFVDERVLPALTPPPHRVPSREGVALLLAEAVTSQAVLRQIHAANACRGCYVLEYGDLEDDPTWVERGVYRYDESGVYYEAGPYVRAAVPAHPVRLDDLPAAVRPPVEAVRFAGLRFADTARIQPADHFACQAWGLNYETLDGELLPLDPDAASGREIPPEAQRPYLPEALGRVVGGARLERELDVPGAQFFLAEDEVTQTRRVVVVGPLAETNAIAEHHVAVEGECALFAHGRVAADSPHGFLVFAHPPGDTLHALVRGLGWLDDEHARRVLRGIAKVLERRHSAGRAHGEVARSLELVWIDGDVVHLLPPCLPPSALRKGAAGVVAPETLTQATTGPQADAWGLALLAFHMTTGRRYFTIEQAALRPFEQVLRGRLAAPSRRARNLRLPEPPPWLDDWFERSLQRDPAARFANASEAAAAIGHHVPRMVDEEEIDDVAPAATTSAGRSPEAPAKCAVAPPVVPSAARAIERRAPGAESAVDTPSTGMTIREKQIAIALTVLLLAVLYGLFRR